MHPRESTEGKDEARQPRTNRRNSPFVMGRAYTRAASPDGDDAISELSSKWSYVVWKRRRWREDEKLLGLLAAQAVQDLERFDICGKGAGADR